LVKLLSTRSLSSLNKHTVDQMYKFFFDVNESNIEEKLLLIREYFEKKVSLDKKIVEANTLIEKELPDDYIEIIGKKD